MGQYIFDYGNMSFEMRIPDYWHTIYAGKPRERLYDCYTIILDKIKNFVDKKRYIIDIGANHGMVSIPCSLMGYKVVGFEPVKANFDDCINNLTLNNCKDFNIYNYALSNENAELKIYVPECPDNASLSQKAAISNMANKGYTEELVRSIKFDDWIIENPQFGDVGFIKIDVQGAEYKVLDGMKKFLSNADDVYMVVEYEHHLLSMGYTYEQLDELIASFGFIHRGEIGGDKLFYKGDNWVGVPGIANTINSTNTINPTIWGSR